MVKMFKQDTERSLDNVPEENVFRCCDESTLRNMKELSHAFSHMEDEGFAYHANMEKNNLSNWLKDIIKGEKLARDLAKSLNQSQAAKAEAERMSFLNNKLGQSE